MCVHILQYVELERGGHACTVGSGGLNIVLLFIFSKELCHHWDKGKGEAAFRCC